MPYYRMLFRSAEESEEVERAEEPEFFGDLNLDQIIRAITAHKPEYNLKPFFYTPLSDADSVAYRHEVMQDLETETLMECIRTFARALRAVREQLAQADKAYYVLQKQRWFLDAVEIYCNAVARLADELATSDLRSRAFMAFRDYLESYVESSGFKSLVAEARQLNADLSEVKYCLLLKGNRIRVLRYEGEIDYAAEVQETFAKFKQGAVKDYSVEFARHADMNHVEAAVLERVARLYPEGFSALQAFCSRYLEFRDEAIVSFDREIQFYVAYLDHVGLLRRVGLPFCYPQVSDVDKEIHADEAFDLALAYKLLMETASVVCNSFYLAGPERILVVSGPNQGGKTTFARMFGQLHYLASLGCPVPGTSAKLFLFDKLFTHFGKEERVQTLQGKLQDDLVRIHDILAQATSRSIVIMNEIFSSTTLHDAIFLGQAVVERLVELDSLGVCVTFIDELASLSEQTVSMVSTIVPDEPTLRTYKIVRRPADGLSYALSIAEKYGVTYESLKERLSP